MYMQLGHMYGLLNCNKSQCIEVGSQLEANHNPTCQNFSFIFGFSYHLEHKDLE